MKAILEIASQHKLKVLEDVAQAFGGRWNDTYLGNLGDGGSFSFYPTKNLGAYGDGGLFVTNDDDAALFARKLRAHGASPTNRYYHESFGYTSRLDEIQAALLRIKLRHIEDQNQNRILAALEYQELLEGTPGIQLPKILPHCHHVFHQYTLRILNGKRDLLANSLKEMGIATMIYYPVCIHQQSVYGGKNFGSFPEAEKAASEVLSIPLWPQMPKEIQTQVVAGLKQFLKS
jgi:dTDP-4-amino-4,6-dideoxygalactose transaminase